MSDYGDLAQYADPSMISTLTPDMVGDDVAGNSCLDRCWKEFEECRTNSTDGGLECLARLNACRMNCAG